MKSIYSLLLIFVLLVVSCKYDNFDEPEAQLSGRIVYQGEPLQLSNGEVYFRLFQDGYTAPIEVRVAQDGAYSALLFGADFKLVFPDNVGPFEAIQQASTGSDTILVSVGGSKSLDIEVMPYYLVRNPQFSVSGRNVSATFRAEQVITGAEGRNIEYVALFVNKSTLVDGRNEFNIARKDISGADITDPANISLNVDVSDIQPVQNYVFARIGIKIQGVERLIFSPVQKLSL